MDKSKKSSSEKESVKAQALKPSLKDQLKAVIKPLAERATFILIIVIFAGLIYVVFTVSTIVQNTQDEKYRQEQSKERINSSFDQQTIEKIENLRSSDNQSAVNLPSGRINPFQ